MERSASVKATNCPLKIKKRHPKAKLINMNLIKGLVERTAISFKK